MRRVAEYSLPPPPPRPGWRDGVDVLSLFLVGAATLGLAVGVGLTLGGGQNFDHRVWRSFRADRFEQGGIEELLHTIEVGPVLVITVLTSVAALAQRHWRLALAIPFFVIGANQSTQLLKSSVLTRGAGGPDLAVSMPSGHATMALTLAIAVVLASPRLLRPLASLIGGVAAGFGGLGTMAERWHRPGDVIAAVGIVLLWAALALAVAGQWQRPRIRAAGFDRAVGHVALAVVGVGIAAYQLHRMGMGPMPGSRAHTLVYGSVLVVGTLIGAGIGLCALVADRHLHRGYRQGPRDA